MNSLFDVTEPAEKKKITKVTVARQAASCVSMHASFYKSNVSNDFKGNRFYAITQNTFEFDKCKNVVTRNYGEDPSRLHVIDLEKYDYDKSVIVYTKSSKYIKLTNEDMKSFLQHSLKTRGYELQNRIKFEDKIINSYEQMTNTETESFFHFYEKRTEHVVRITLLKNGHVVESLRVNVGYLTVIHTLKPFEKRNAESRERMSDRLSSNHPVIIPKANKNIEAICVFNEADPANRMLIDMLQF